jgi:CheY-like chemotaxis protein
MEEVLVVDDDDAVRDAFARTLRHAGFRVTAVENGVSALQQIGQREFDAVVCDYRMPTLGGLGFFQQLEEQFPALAGRVVFATAYAEDPKIRTLLEQTGQPVLAKPVDTQNLVVEVKRLIAKQRKGGTK